MKETHVILGVHITERARNAVHVQQVLTTHAGSIKTRLGLHEPQGDNGGPNGLLLLEIVGGEAKADVLAAGLVAIEGVHVQRMVFDHPE
jgi:hypothetical protein